MGASWYGGEFAAIFGRELCDGRKLKEITPDISEMVKTVQVESSSCGKAYMGLTMKGIQIKPSSQRIQTRLKSAGINPKNNIVDISNYVMLEFGIPNHIFDLDKLSGDTIKIEGSNPPKFKTLDDIERDLVPGDTVVSDSDGLWLLQVLWGGQCVSDNTTNIF